ncbi:MAG: phosphoribosylformylglycinamidine cyclo-ligase [Candidatus Alcyoniella australis]|nr:phosphoribosylformylglycinamidine cyclo-ligase [Candidatus Alcyoniella australis]
MKRSLTYSDAGVDIEAGSNLVERIKPLVRATFRPEVITEIGGFASLFKLHIDQWKNPVLVSSTDGVGTKLKIAFMMDKHDTVGIDLVAMVLNDVIVNGGQPLFMLDYFATGKLKIDTAVQVIRGISEGCSQADCSLIGGETAEMPDFYPDGEYDLAGFGVGIVENEEIIDGSQIRVGDKLISIGSSGLHSNGYSLVRKIVFDRTKCGLEDHIDELGRTLGEELLEPTKIYVRTVRNLLRDFPIHGICNITGGGLTENIPRILPARCRAILRNGSWEIPPIFEFLQRSGEIETAEMNRTFNNGIGMVLIVPEQETDNISIRLEGLGEKVSVIGEIVERKNDETALQFE